MIIDLQSMSENIKGTENELLLTRRFSKVSNVDAFTIHNLHVILPERELGR